MSLTKAMLAFYPKGSDPVTIGTVAPGNRTGKWSSSTLSSLANQLNVDNIINNLDDGIELDNLGGGENKFTGEKKCLTFQFNPSTLRISAYGGGLAPIYNYVMEANKSAEDAAKNIDKADNGNGNNAKKNGSQIIYGPVETNITVEFKVIFDAEKNTDAFMADKLAALSSPVKTAYEAITRENYSVREIVEGFLAVIRNQDARRVAFYWGSLCYIGRMNNVQCNYTMFNPAGEPIRAEVNIRILANSNLDTEEWRKKYTNTLLDYAKSETSNISNIANNLINLQL